MTDRVTEKHKMSYIIHKKPLKKSNKNGILTSEIRNFKKKNWIKRDPVYLAEFHIEKTPGNISEGGITGQRPGIDHCDECRSKKNQMNEPPGHNSIP